MPDALQLDVHPLTPDRFPDLAAMFEEGGDPKWCWCVFFRFRGRDWSNSTAARESGRPRGPRRATAGARSRRLPRGPRRRLGQPWAARGLRAADALEDPRARRRHARLVDRVLRGLAQGPGSGRRTALHVDGGDRLRPRARRDDARGLPGRCLGRASARGQRVPRHARDVRDEPASRSSSAGSGTSSTPVRPIVRLELRAGHATTVGR